LPGEDPRLAIERQEVGVLGHQHLRQERLGRHAASDRPLRCGRLHHRLFAGPTAVAETADHPHPQLGRHDIEHLARVLADHVQGSAATGAALVLKVNQQLEPRQVRRQGAQVAPARPWRPSSITAPRTGFLRRLGRSGGLLEVLQAELQRGQFGRRSEKLDPDQLQLPDQQT